MGRGGMLQQSGAHHSIILCRRSLGWQMIL